MVPQYTLNIHNPHVPLVSQLQSLDWPSPELCLDFLNSPSISDWRLLVLLLSLLPCVYQVCFFLFIISPFTYSPLFLCILPSVYLCPLFWKVSGWITLMRQMFSYSTYPYNYKLVLSPAGPFPCASEVFISKNPFSCWSALFYTKNIYLSCELQPMYFLCGNSIATFFFFCPSFLKAQNLPSPLCSIPLLLNWHSFFFTYCVLNSEAFIVNNQT